MMSLLRMSQMFEAGAKLMGKSGLDKEAVERVWEALCPGFFDTLDAHAVLPLIAPRPLLLVMGELDEKNPIDGVHIPLHAQVLAAMVRALQARR